MVAVETFGVAAEATSECMAVLFDITDVHQVELFRCGRSFAEYEQ